MCKGFLCRMRLLKYGNTLNVIVKPKQTRNPIRNIHPESLMMFEHSLPDSLEAASPVYPSDSDLQNDARTKHFLQVPSKMWQSNENYYYGLITKTCKTNKARCKTITKTCRTSKTTIFYKKIIR